MCSSENVFNSISDELSKELQDERRGFDRWLKNTNQDDKVIIPIVKIPLGGRMSRKRTKEDAHNGNTEES
jgi:hypothetical protein